VTTRHADSRQVRDDRRGGPAQRVLPVRDELHVRDVDAGAIAAEVIWPEPVRYRAALHLPCYAMRCSVRLAEPPRAPVPLSLIHI